VTKGRIDTHHHVVPSFYADCTGATPNSFYVATAWDLAMGRFPQRLRTAKSSSRDK
jgi:hypothetical protein